MQHFKGGWLRLACAQRLEKEAGGGAGATAAERYQLVPSRKDRTAGASPKHQTRYYIGFLEPLFLVCNLIGPRHTIYIDIYGDHKTQRTNGLLARQIPHGLGKASTSVAHQRGK